jgi:hypothetical protein
MLALRKHSAGLDKLNWEITAEMINRVLIPEIECIVYLNQETPVVKNIKNEESLDLNSKI